MNCILLRCIGCTVFNLCCVSCMQNNSHPIYSWFGAGNCRPTHIERTLLLVREDRKSVQDFKLTLSRSIESDFGLILSPYYKDFLHMERELNGDHINVYRIKDGHSLGPEPMFAFAGRDYISLNKEGMIIIHYSTYFPDSLVISIETGTSFKGQIRVNKLSSGQKNIIMLNEKQ